MRGTFDCSTQYTLCSYKNDKDRSLFYFTRVTALPVIIDVITNIYVMQLSNFVHVHLVAVLCS